MQMQAGKKNTQMVEINVGLELLAWTCGGFVSDSSRVHDDLTLLVFGG